MAVKRVTAKPPEPGGGFFGAVAATVADAGKVAAKAAVATRTAAGKRAAHPSGERPPPPGSGPSRDPSAVGPVASARSAAPRSAPPPTAAGSVRTGGHALAPHPSPSESTAAASAGDAIALASKAPAATLNDLGSAIAAFAQMPLQPEARPSGDGYKALTTALPVDPSADAAIYRSDAAIGRHDAQLAAERATEAKRTAGRQATSIPKAPPSVRALIASANQITEQTAITQATRNERRIDLGLKQTLATVKSQVGAVAIPAAQLKVDPTADAVLYHRDQQVALHDMLVADDAVTTASRRLAAARETATAAAARAVTAELVAATEQRQIAVAKEQARGQLTLDRALDPALDPVLAPLGSKASAGTPAAPVLEQEHAAITRAIRAAQDGTTRRALIVQRVTSETASARRTLAAARMSAAQSLASDRSAVAAQRADIGTVTLRTFTAAEVPTSGCVVADAKVKTAAWNARTAQLTLRRNSIVAQHDAFVASDQRATTYARVAAVYHQTFLDTAQKLLQADPRLTRAALLARTQAATKGSRVAALGALQRANAAYGATVQKLGTYASAITGAAQTAWFAADPHAESQAIVNLAAKQTSGGQRYSAGAHLTNLVIGSYAAAQSGEGVPLRAGRSAPQYTPAAIKAFQPVLNAIRSAGGPNGKLLVLPLSIGETKGPMQRTVLFQVAGKNGRGSTFIDLGGKRYNSLSDFQHRNKLGDGTLSVLQTTANMQIERGSNGNAALFVGRAHVDSGSGFSLNPVSDLEHAAGAIATVGSFLGGLGLGALKLGAKLMTDPIGTAEDVVQGVEDAAPVLEGLAIDAGGAVAEVASDGALTPLAAEMEEEGTTLALGSLASDAAGALASGGSDGAATTAVDDTATSAASGAASRGARSLLTNSGFRTSVQTLWRAGGAASTYLAVKEEKARLDAGLSIAPWSSPQAALSFLNLAGSVGMLGHEAVLPGVSSLTKAVSLGERTESSLTSGARIVDGTLGGTMALDAAVNMGQQGYDFLRHPNWSSAGGLAVAIGQIGAGEGANRVAERYYGNRIAAATPDALPTQLRAAANLGEPAVPAIAAFPAPDVPVAPLAAGVSAFSAPHEPLPPETPSGPFVRFGSIFVHRDVAPEFRRAHAYLSNSSVARGILTRLAASEEPTFVFPSARTDDIPSDDTSAYTFWNPELALEHSGGSLSPAVLLFSKLVHAEKAAEGGFEDVTPLPPDSPWAGRARSEEHLNVIQGPERRAALELDEDPRDAAGDTFYRTGASDSRRRIGPATAPPGETFIPFAPETASSYTLLDPTGTSSDGGVDFVHFHQLRVQKELEPEVRLAASYLSQSPTGVDVLHGIIHGSAETILKPGYDSAEPKLDGRAHLYWNPSYGLRTLSGQAVSAPMVLFARMAELAKWMADPIGYHEALRPFPAESPQAVYYSPLNESVANLQRRVAEKVGEEPVDGPIVGTFFNATNLIDRTEGEPIAFEVAPILPEDPDSDWVTVYPDDDVEKRDSSRLWDRLAGIDNNTPPFPGWDLTTPPDEGARFAGHQGPDPSSIAPPADLATARALAEQRAPDAPLGTTSETLLARERTIDGFVRYGTLGVHVDVVDAFEAAVRAAGQSPEALAALYAAEHSSREMIYVMRGRERVSPSDERPDHAYWDPNAGTSALVGDLAHANEWTSDRARYLANIQPFASAADRDRFSSPEEYRVFAGIEARVARALGETPRADRAAAAQRGEARGPQAPALAPAPAGTTVDALLAPTGAFDEFLEFGALHVHNDIAPHFVEAAGYLSRSPEGLAQLYWLEHGHTNVYLRPGAPLFVPGADARGYIFWNPFGKIDAAGGTLSPSMVLLHEIAHANEWLRDPVRYFERARPYAVGTLERAVWGSPAERDIILGVERRVALALEEDPRPDHHGDIAISNSPTDRVSIDDPVRARNVLREMNALLAEGAYDAMHEIEYFENAPRLPYGAIGPP
jgi:hypothetical protein